MIHEFQGWGWLAFTLYALPIGLFPLAASFALDQTLWLRLTPANDAEVMVARYARFLATIGIPAGIGLAAALMAAVAHHLSATEVLVTWTGFLAHQLAAAGLFLAVGRWFANPVEQYSASVFAFLAPLISFLAFASVRDRLPDMVARWWPYAVPFAERFEPGWRHFATTAVVGAGLAAATIAMSGVSVVRSRVLAPSEYEDRSP